MTVNVSTMFIPVHDPDAALGFYRDGLGLEVRNDVASDGFRSEQVCASGAEVLQEPVSQPWSARDCAFRDPSGNMVRIAQA
jgi:catechol 2,3-dioxygenase-like lactoylglutathione lyase family enzyme